MSADIARLAQDLAVLNFAMVRPHYDARGIFLDEEATVLAMHGLAEQALLDLSPAGLDEVFALSAAELRVWHAQHIAPAFHARILQELDS